MPAASTMSTAALRTAAEGWSGAEWYPPDDVDYPTNDGFEVIVAPFMGLITRRQPRTQIPNGQERQ